MCVNYNIRNDLRVSTGEGAMRAYLPANQGELLVWAPAFASNWQTATGETGPWSQVLKTTVAG